VLRKTLLSFFVLACAAGLTGAMLQSAPPATRSTEADSSRSLAERDVFLSSGLSEEELLTFTTNVVASGHPGAILIDSPTAKPYLSAFLEAFQAHRVIPVRSSNLGLRPLQPSLSELLATKKVVVCPAEPRRLLLHAACLAGAARARLVVDHGTSADATALRRVLANGKTEEVLAVAGCRRLCRDLANVHVVRLADEQAVMDACLRRQTKHGRIKSLVVANPADTRPDVGSMSTLAPWIALQRHAALILTNEAGTNVEAVVKAALQNEHLARVDALILVANLQAIPMEHRPNPIPDGKDAFIEMEPMTPAGSEPTSFATGRIFHEDRGVVALMLARERLLAKADHPPQALVASNPGGSLPLLETFSRNTASELHNAGYETHPFFGRQATEAELHRLLPTQTIFLWEGHHSTLVQDYRIHQWPEPLQPSLVFLQSCLALQEPKAQPFLERGAVGVIGTSSRTYSGSGGAFSLAFFDALIYEDQSVGAALRSAKNFMLAFAQLKEQRLGARMRLGGANVRAAWAFSLWGDPTVKLPRPAPPDGALDTVRHRVRGNTITLSLPHAAHEKVVSVKYQTEMRPNARLAGLLTKEEKAEAHRLVPLVFAEVRLPAAPAGKLPHLHGTLPASRWVFCYDARRACGYLLAMPRATDADELRFHVAWE